MNKLPPATLFKETEEIKRILGQQTAFWNYLDMIYKLYKRLQYEGDIDIASILITMFDYGYIEGKRAERARRKAPRENNN